MTGFDPNKLNFVRLHRNVILPTRADDGSVGYDLHCIEPFELYRGIQMRIPLGFAVAIPNGCYGRIAPRSGLADQIGLQILAGVIDPSYRKEVETILLMTKAKYRYFDVGSRIAQLIVETCATPDAQWVDALPETDRQGGFGSTGLGAMAPAARVAQA